MHALTLKARQNAPLLAIVAAGLVFTAYYTLEVTEYSVMTDELLYVKLALGIGDTLSPLPEVHGEDFAVFSQLYPLLTAPVFGFFDMPSAFRIVHFLNAVLMVSAAIPAYLLTREVVVHRASAYLVAALTIAVPWMTMSTMVLTDVATYPAFVWAILWLQRTIAAPSAARDLLALAGIILAFLGRTQFVVLALIAPVAVIAHEVGFQRSGPARASVRDALRVGVKRSVTEHRVLAGAAALGLLVAVPLALAGSLSGALGNYDAATERTLLPDGIWNAMAEHIDVVAVAIGIVPFVLALAWCVSTIWRPLERGEHAYAVLLALVVGALVLQVSSFNLNFAHGATHDRYLFYIAPLLFVGMVACLRGARRPWGAVLLAGLAFAAIVGIAEYAESPGPYFGSPASAFYSVIDGWSTALTVGTLILTAATAAAIRYGPRNLVFWAVGLSVLAFCVIETRYVFDRVVLQEWGSGRLISGTELEGKDWIDGAVPADASVGLVPVPFFAQREGQFVAEHENVWWEAEFWNKRVDRSYSYLGSPTYTPFPHGEMSLDYETGRLITSEPGEQSQYLVVAPTDPRFRPAGRVVDADGLELIEARSPYRAEWATRGVAPDGHTQAGFPATLRVFGEEGQRTGKRVSVTFSSASGQPGRYRIAARGAAVGGKLPAGVALTRAFQLCLPENGFSDVTISVIDQSGVSAGTVAGLQLSYVRTQPVAACRA